MAEMRSHDTAIGNLGRHVPQPAGNVFIGEAMESVAAYALRIELLGDCKAVGHLGVSPVKRGIEAGNLGQVRKPMQDRPDRRKIVGLMQWGQRYKAFKLIEHSIGHDCWRRVGWSTVHDAMPDGHRQSSTHLGAQEDHELVERGRHGGDLSRGPCLVRQALASDAPGPEARLHADAVDLPFQAPLKPVIPADLEHLKLDAGAARVEHQDGLAHGSGPNRLLRPAAVSKKHRDSA